MRQRSRPAKDFWCRIESMQKAAVARCLGVSTAAIDAISSLLPTGNAPLMDPTLIPLCPPTTPINIADPFPPVLLPDLLSWGNGGSRD
jgi:hypothetical protein